MKLPNDIQATVARALAEDIGTGDVTAGLIPAEKQASATVISAPQACSIDNPDCEACQ